MKKLDGERWLPFEDARKYAQSLRLRNHQSWLLFCRTRKRRNDVPANPSVTYKGKGWRGWGDFLGTGNQRSRKWRNFSKAHEYVLKLELKTEKEWRQFTKSSDRPSDIPTNPNTVYKGKGWISWTHWLRGEDKPQFRGFEEAREWARNAGIAGARAYRILAVENKLPKDIPRSPNTKYREWKGWGDFLGTGSESPAKSKNFVDFKKARDKVRRLKLNSCSEWRYLCKSSKRPPNIPCNPDRYYKNHGWKSWGDFLGTDRVASRNMEWLPFKKARSIARNLRLASREEWRTLQKLPKGIPRTPDEVYEEWNGWTDWLGFRFSRKRR